MRLVVAPDGTVRAVYDEVIDLATLGPLAIARATLEHQWGDVDRGLARSLVGSAETIRHQIKEYVAAGVSHFEIKFIYPSLERHSQMLQLFAREVLAAFS